MRKTIVVTFALLLGLVGCAPQDKTQTGAMYGTAGGAVAGALLGQVIGGDTKGTLIGAAIGAAVGGLSGAGVGRMMDNQERDMRQALAASNAAQVRREGNLLAITLKGDVTFDTNSAVVRPGLYTEIDRIGNVMRQYPETVMLVEGHTDSVGAEEYNLDLSRRRAEAVRSLLVQRGVDTARIEVAALGESTPVASNDHEAGRQLNRRVELKVAPRQQ